MRSGCPLSIRPGEKGQQIDKEALGEAAQDPAATAGGELKFSRGRFPAPMSRLPRRNSNRENPGPPDLS